MSKTICTFYFILLFQADIYWTDSLFHGTLICQAHMDGTPQNFAVWKGGMKLLHGHKSISAYKSMPYKNAGVWKQNITCWIKLLMLNQCMYVCVKTNSICGRQYVAFFLTISIYNFL
jgi:hypothetical protein